MNISFSAALSGVTVYRSLLELSPVAAMKRLFRSLDRERGRRALDAYSAVFYALAREGYDSLSEYLSDQLRYGVSPYAEAVARGRVTERLTEAARRDLALFSDLAALEPGGLKRQISLLVPDDWAERVQDLPEWGCGPLPGFDELTEFYRVNGCGTFSRYHAFVWQNGALHPVPNPDFVPEDAFLGYERQRNQVIENTRLLVAGRQANNVLLYGMSGTGKSATVKGLLGMAEFESLRLIEVQREELCDIPQLVRDLAHRPQKFIIFIDDLSFDREDRTFSSLKSILEGSLEPRPDNVAVYCTSNRRHLVRQNFSDRSGDEIDASETVQDKTALADRFGLRVLYSEWTKPQFIDMAVQMAQSKGVAMEEEALRKAAVRWEARHTSRSPRSALQFTASMLTAQLELS